ncbi:hypothetical protein D3C81_1835830 [compost metagenome]
MIPDIQVIPVSIIVARNLYYLIVAILVPAVVHGGGGRPCRIYSPHSVRQSLQNASARYSPFKNLLILQVPDDYRRMIAVAEEHSL